jgi:uncharacterized membrane protein YtjA (UPF0391 family)
MSTLVKLSVILKALTFNAGGCRYLYKKFTSMNKYILILFIISVVTGVIGFTMEFPGATALRVTFLIAADIMVILLFGKILFWTQKKRKQRRTVRT